MSGPGRETWAARLEATLAGHRAAIELIQALSSRQSTLIDAGQGEVLLALLTERQHAIDRLMIGPESLPALLQDLESSASWVDQDLGERVRTELHALAGMLTSIAAADERDRGAMQMTCERLQRELAETGAAKQARAAYATRQGVRSTFADQQG